MPVNMNCVFKKIIAVLLAFVFLAEKPVTANDMQNILQSGDFEDSSVIWKVVATNTRGSVVFDSQNKVSGRYSLKLSNLNGGNVRCFSTPLILNQTKPEPFAVSFWAQRDNSGKTLTAVDFKITYTDSTSVYWLNKTTLNPKQSNKWVFFSAQYNPPKPIRQIEVWPIANGEPINFWVDDLKVMVQKKLSAKDSRKTLAVLKNNLVKVTMINSGDDNELVDIGDIVDLQSGTSFFGKNKDSATNIWEVNFVSNGKLIRCSSGNPDASRISAVKGGQLLQVAWNRVKIEDNKFGKIGVTGFLADGSAAIEWKIAVSAPEGMTINDVTFPRFSALGPVGDSGTDDYYALPYTSGKLFKNPAATLNYKSVFYGSGISMQFHSLYDGKAGLYLATHDPDMHKKDFHVYRQNGTLGFKVNQVPEGDCTSRRQWIQNYPFVTEVFHGDWFDAAQIYRKWAVEQKWCARGRLCERKNFSKRLAQTCAWIKTGAVGGKWYDFKKPDARQQAKLSPEQRKEMAGELDVDACLGRVEHLKNSLGVPVGAWMTDNWHTCGNIGIDGLGPLYEPRKNFDKLADEYRKAGIPLMPYVNFQRWSTELASYDAANMLKLFDGKPRILPEHNTQVGIMCPGSENIRKMWLDKILDLHRLGCTAIYLDELATNGNFICYDKSHNHLSGDGTARMRDNISLIDMVKKEVHKEDPDFFTMGEQGCETYIGANDLNLWWFASSGNQDIGLFSAVYHDYTVGMGRVPGKWYGPHCEKDYADKSGNSDLEELALNLGKCFVHGNQLGVVRDDFDKYSSAGTVMLRKLSALRHKTLDYLLYGQMLRPVSFVKPVGKTTVRQMFLGFAPVDTDAVLSGAFRSCRDKSVALVFFNITGDRQDIITDLTPGKYFDNAKGKKFTVTKLTSDGEYNEGWFASQEGHFPYEFSIEKFSPLILIISEADTIDGIKEISPASFSASNNEDKSSQSKNISVEYSFRPQKSIMKGDRVFISALVRNPDGRANTEEFSVKAPNGWKVSPASILGISSSEKETTLNFILSGKSKESSPLKFGISRRDDDNLNEWQIMCKGKRSIAQATYLDTKEVLENSKIWNKATFYKLAKPLRRSGINDKIEAAFAAAYDREALHLRVEVTGDNTPENPTPGGDIWKGDCVQISLNGMRDTVEYDRDFALADTGDAVILYDFKRHKTVRDIQCRLLRLEDKNIYLVSFPWNLFRSGPPPAEGDHIGFSITYNDADRTGFKGWLEWTPGVCGGKKPALYGDIVL